MKINVAFVALSVLVSILIFQNCEKIVLSDKIDKPVNALSLKAYDVDAGSIIDTMLGAGIKDDFDFDETLDLSAEIMTCGTKPQATNAECVFTKEKTKFTATNSSAALVKSFLNNMGIARDCPSCNDSESYTVKNIKCKRNPKFPRDSLCEFAR
ncbi:MAG: hypothetical protein AABY53_00540 [Bdellovibrionota bacterium]